MKKLTIAIYIAFCLVLISGGFLYLDLNDQLTDAKSQVSSLKTNFAYLQNSPPAPAQTAGADVSMANLISIIQPIIVRVDVTQANSQESGSGIIIGSDGHIITNNHVIAGAKSIMVTIGDKQHDAAVLGRDADLDLAILKLSDSSLNLPTALLGNAGDIVVGGWVVAAGFPLGPALPGPASFTQGMISAVRTMNGQRYIQTDVVINPGNSGGALVNGDNGRVIGITSGGVLPPDLDVEGINLAIPVDVAQTYIQKILNDEAR